jgi:anti-sigma regulatory factor (Ser/Thr protein kinase)
MSDGLDFRIPARPEYLRDLRKAVREGVEAMGVAERARDQIVLVLDELVSNAIEHGDDYRTGGGELTVQVRLIGGGLWMEFIDPDMPGSMVAELHRALERWDGSPPPLTNERGRGLFLISAYVDELIVQPAQGGGLHVRGRIASAESP